MAVKFSPLGDHPSDTSMIRKPFLMFITIVGFMMFFVLYIATSTTVPPSSAVDHESLGSSSDYSASGHAGAVNDSHTVGEASQQAFYPTTTTKTVQTPPPTTTSNSYSSSDDEDDASNADADASSEESASSTTSTSSREVEHEPPVPTLNDLSNIYQKYVIYEDKCRIRSYDYNDPAIYKKYFAKEPRMCAKNAKPFIFYPVMNETAGSSCVGFNETAFKTSWNESDFANWQCTYKEAIRDLKYQVIDKHHDFGTKKTLNAGDCPKEEFIWIECGQHGSNATYQQPLMLPLVKAVRASVRPNNIGKQQLHVLVVGLDSVSRLNAHRQFPKTMELLQSNKNLVELFGYNKIGVNSAPNQIPLLTGIPYAVPGLKSRIGSNYFDNLTRYLWEDYEERGYRTMFYEEQWIYGLFVYPSLKGFKQVPTTYWPRPMMQAIDKSTLKAAGAGWCVGPDFPAKHYLDYTYNTMKILGNDRPLFSYSWLSETAHDQVYGGKRVDAYFHEFFTKMTDDGILNNTAVFFISDHGFRFGAFRKTALGRYEDMLPYGFVLLPDWYYDENPDALNNLRTNSRRLVTVYDLHATLLELADSWSEGRVTRTANGFSLLSNVIPSDRTCEDADINFQFCSCFEPQPYDRKGNLSLSLARFVIDTINGELRKNNATAKCRQWSLDSVDDFVRLSEGNQWTDFYKATIKTSPAAQFEVAAKLHRPNHDWTLLSDVDRTDWFSSHAKCVKKESFERFCYCK